MSSANIGFNQFSNPIGPRITIYSFNQFIQRVDLIKDYWRNAVYYAYVVHKNEIEEGLEIVRKANRKDLEEELIDYLDEIHR